MYTTHCETGQDRLLNVPEEHAQDIEQVLNSVLLVEVSAVVLDQCM